MGVARCKVHLGKAAGEMMKNILVVLFAVIFSGFFNADSVAQKRGDLKIEPYVFENARREKVDAEMGRLLVPENRRNPRSRLIELAFVRFKSTSPNPGPPIVYLAGGPGSSGIGSARGNRFPVFMAMREFGDVIALDQRSVGESKPNTECPETFELPPGIEPSHKELLTLLIARSRTCAERYRKEGIDLTGYNTNENADDVEDLRIALGAKKIGLWGISYGTHLGLTVIKRHGKNVDRAILAGIEGLDSTLKLPADIDRHLVEIGKYVKADANLSKEIPDFHGLVKNVLASLEKQPVIVETTDPQTKTPAKVLINKFVMQTLTGATVGTDTLLRYPRVYLAASKGDYSEIAAFWLGFTRQNIGSAMSFMMDCSSGATPARHRRIERESKLALLGNAANNGFLDLCTAWGNPDLGNQFRAPVKSDVPVLFISGTLDGRTPVTNGEDALKGFPNGKHLIVEGAWHSDPLFLASPGIKDVMLEFMRGEKLSTLKITAPPPRFAPLKQ